MIEYIIRRLLYTGVSVIILSMVVWFVIQLPPGDFLSVYISRIEQEAGGLDKEQVEALRRYWGLDGTPVQQYWRWITRFARGDMGRSFEWNQPVANLIKQRLPFTMLISVTTLLFVYMLSIPIGIYVATHQYGLGDYLLSVLGFVGMASPDFMIALILMYLFFKLFGVSVGGLFSSEYAMAPWSFARVWDLLQHLWVPIIVIGTSGTAGLIRVMRGLMLDELSQQYVVTARAKGLPERRILLKYPVRLAMNPIVSTIGWQLPNIVSGSTIVSIVLSLPTTGPLIYRSLLIQDMFMAGSVVMVLGILTIIGTLISDILLVVVDPRIRFERQGS